MRDGKKCTDYPPLTDYGIIGDCRTVALLSKTGSIDWYCPGRFDFPAVFCRLLDINKGGYFQVSPREPFSARRHYFPQTNILYTEFHAGNGKIGVTDFMPVYRESPVRRGRDIESNHLILKKIEGLGGDTDITVEFKPTFDYARGNCRFELTSRGAAAICAAHSLRMSAFGVKLLSKKVEQGTVFWHCTIKSGEIGWFVLTAEGDAWGPPNEDDASAAARFEHLLAATRQYWVDWAALCQYRGPYQTQVVRSALTLKLLIFEPTGAIVAAPTASLPENIGGVRNWDYRFSWLRDSSLIIYALLSIGYKHEAADFFEWLQEVNHQDARHEVGLLYDVDGRKMTSEQTLPHLEGYCRSAPVRIGNAAGGQVQTDIYGELLNAAHLYFLSGIGKRTAEEAATSDKERILKTDWPMLRDFVDKAMRRWREPDNGIWEVRAELQNYLYSKLMCWAALDRGIMLASTFAVEAPLSEWVKTRQEIADAILNEGYDAKLGAFIQAFDCSDLDASALIIPRLGFLSGSDARVVSTIGLLQKKLTHNGLVYRYRGKDGLPGSENTFSLCSYWMVDALALSGQLREAHDLFEFIYSFANDLGLLSEEIDPVGHLLIGNFPQGFTHMALINSAVNLAKITKHGPEIKPENEAQRAGNAATAAAEGYARS